MWPSAPGRHRASRPHGRPRAAAGHHVPLVRSPVSGPLGRVRVSAAVRRAAVRLRVRVSAAASVRIPPGFTREGAGSPGPMASPGVAPGSRAPSSPARAFRPRLSDWPGGRGAPARLTVVWICSGRVGVEARAPAGGLERSRGVREGGGLQPGRRPGHTAPPASSCWRTRPRAHTHLQRPPDLASSLTRVGSASQGCGAPPEFTGPPAPPPLIVLTCPAHSSERSVEVESSGSWVQMLPQVGRPWADSLTSLFPVSSCVNEVGAVLVTQMSMPRARNSARHMVSVRRVFAVVTVAMMMMTMTVCLDTRLGKGQE